MEEMYDVIVVGAGNGGLCSAAYSAKRGLKTLLIEKHNLPGGCASSFRRGRFEFETALHELCEFGPASNPGAIRRIFEELDLDVEMCPVEDCFRVVNPGQDGLIEPYDVTMPNGREPFLATMEGVCPGSRKSVSEFFSLCDMASVFMKYMTLCKGKVDRRVLERSFSDFLPYANMSVEQVFDKLDMPAKARNIISTYWSYICVPTDELEFVLFGNLLIEYVDRHAYIPKLRSHGISTAFDQKIRENGGEIWYGTKVERILVREGKAYGVIVGGKEIHAKAVIANVNPHIVYGSLIEKSEVPQRALKLANARTFGISAVTVYYGLNRSAEELGIKDYSRFVNKGDPRAAFERFTKFDPKMIGGVMNCLNVAIPDYSPEGTCILWGTTLYRPGAFDDIDPVSYRKLKSGIAYGFAMFYKMTTGIDILPYIEEVEIATPFTFARYLGTPYGSIYGYQGQKWDNMLPRMLAKEDEEYIDGLFFCGGHDTWLDGYNSSYRTGKIAADEVIKALGKEIEV